MPKFSANFSYLFQEVPYFDRFELAAQCGFQAVDLPDPYGPAARDTQRALLRHGLSLASISGPPPNYTGGAPGFASLSGDENRFRHDVRRVSRYATALNARLIAYRLGEGTEDALIANLRWAADYDKKRTIVIKAEPGNTLLNDVFRAAEIVREVNRDTVRLMFDTLETHALHGDVLAVWKDVAGLVAHVGVAAPPDRSAPGPGPIDFDTLFTLLDDANYRGWVSAAYVPDTRQTAQSLQWMQ